MKEHYLERRTHRESYTRVWEIDPEVLELKRQLKELRRQCIDSTNRLELENIRQARELIERDKKVRDLETRNSVSLFGAKGPRLISGIL